jgi:hypothetical protein
LTGVNYSALLKQASAEQPPTVRAMVDRGRMGKGGSEARRWRCSDAGHYAVKHPNNAQVVGTPQLLATEYVVARVGAAMGAPVFPCAVVDVAPELVAGVTYENQPGVEIQPGRAFGSQIRGEAGYADADVAPVTWRKSETNRSRVAAVCVLHSLFILGDSAQFVVRTAAPYHVWSIDHGHFMAGGGPWPADLGSQTDVSDIPTALFPELSLTSGDLKKAVIPLVQLSDQKLANLIAPMPAEWLPSAAARAACLEFVAKRRDKLAAIAGVDSGEHA